MNEQLVEGGYDFKLVKEDKNLECPICLLLLREAKGTQCRHLLCKVCFGKLQRSSDDAGRDFICPTCKEKIDVNQVHPNFYIDGVVTGSDVYCLQQVSGCKWVGTLAAYLRDHHEKCDYVIISCDNIGCGDKLARNLMKKHAIECPHHLVNCVYCQMKVKLNQLYEQHYTKCQKIPVDCVMGCGVQVPREKMQEHLDEVCGLVAIECHFSNAGCKSKVVRMDVHKHNVEFTHIHMSLLCDQLNQSQKKIEQLEVANDQSQKKINQLEVYKAQSENKIKQLEVANSQSQKKIDQFSRTISDMKRSKYENQARQAYKRFESKVMQNEQKHRLNPTASPSMPLVNEGQDLPTLFRKCVQKWIDKNQIHMELTYQEWYKIVDEKMEKNSVHKYKDLMFVKVVKRQQHKVIKWRVLPWGLDEKLRVHDSGVVLDVESFSSSFNDCFICHPIDGMQQMNCIAENSFSFNVDPPMALFDELLLCARRKPNSLVSWEATSNK